MGISEAESLTAGLAVNDLIEDDDPLEDLIISLEDHLDLAELSQDRDG